jgi:hypothetical protein
MTICNLPSAICDPAQRGDRWFLLQINELVDFEEELAGTVH